MSQVDSDDDKQSKSSTCSVTKTPIQCPYCSWCKQARYLFNHVLSEHKEKVYETVGTVKKLKDDLEEGNCIELNQAITFYNPDDEFKEFPENKDFTVYGCLACKKSFQTSSRAKAHWRTNPKCHKPHTKEVQKIIDKVEDFENKKKGKEWLQNLTSAELDICIERFRRWYWRMLQNDIPWLESLPLNKGITFPEKYKHYEFKTPSDFKGKGQKFEAYIEYSELIYNLYRFIKKRFTMDSDYRIPEPVGFEENFEGLPPVGTSFDRFVMTDETKQKKEEEYRLKLEEIYDQKAKELEKQKIELHKKLLSLAEKESELSKKEQSVKDQEKKSLEPILEETIGQTKQKRNSFTIPRPNPSELITRSPSPSRAAFPQIILDTKTKREPKRAPPV